MKQLAVSKQAHICAFSPPADPPRSTRLSQPSSVLMVEPRELYRTHHMLLPVIGSLGASPLTLNGNMKQPDPSCTLTHVQTNIHTYKRKSHMQPERTLQHTHELCSRAHTDSTGCIYCGLVSWYL